MHTDDLKTLAQMSMPFGKYKDRLLIDLPEAYLLWFEKQGYPEGKLGELLQLATEIHKNGLTQLLEPLKTMETGKTLCMTPKQLIKLAKNTPEAISFDQVISTIDNYYQYTAIRFYNGLEPDRITNEAGSNSGSCKIFCFSKIHGLDQPQTLSLFGTIYRQDVLGTPDSTDHMNIRNFMKYGWEGIRFDGLALKEI